MSEYVRNEKGYTEWLGKTVNLGECKISGVSAMFPDGSFLWRIQTHDTIYSFRIDNVSAHIFADAFFSGDGSTCEGPHQA
jgi:hypothetical protein